jgi:uncharacterized oxidoreductase
MAAEKNMIGIVSCNNHGKGRWTALDIFKNEVDTFIRYLKSSRLMPGFDEINMPGEIEQRRRRKMEKVGISVDDTTWQQICEIAAAVDVSLE